MASFVKSHHVLGLSLFAGLVLTIVSAANSYQIAYPPAHSGSDVHHSSLSKHWGKASLSAGLDTTAVVFLVVACISAYLTSKAARPLSGN